ncbi:MAG: ShlB/FhaC/HecB family hemolysin secretion/activation protein [Pseudomonadota bacterium]
MKRILRNLMYLIGVLLAFGVAAAEDAPFDILEFRVEGNTVLAPSLIENVVYPFMGPGKGIKDVEAARQALETAYRDSGYLTVFVDIPEQEVKGGLVRLRATEGKVERLRVVGADYFSPGRIKSITEPLAEGNVPYWPEVQKGLARVNSSPDRRVTPILRAGRSPGTVEAELKVDDRLPLHGSLELNDRYSANTSRTRLSASVHYDNLWQREHSLTLGYQTAPEAPSESSIFSATYLAPLPSGRYLAVYGVHSESDVGAVGDVNVVGNGDILGLRYIWPLPGLPDWSHSLTLGVDYKDFQESTAVQGADQINTPISYLPFSLAYSGTLKGEGRSTQVGATLNFGIKGLADEEIECTPGVFMNEFACKRYLGKPNFMVLKLSGEHEQELGAGWSLTGRGQVQAASGPLISNEQFAAGGADSVRGYLESSAMGDDGVQGSLELRAPNLGPRLSSRISLLQPLVFVDAARLWVQDALPGQTDRFSLLSAGLGLRFKGLGGLLMDLDVARPHTDVGQVRDGEERVHVRLAYEW